MSLKPKIVIYQLPTLLFKVSHVLGMIGAYACDLLCVTGSGVGGTFCTPTGSTQNGQKTKLEPSLGGPAGGLCGIMSCASLIEPWHSAAR
jgi:hypothetical protein